MFQRSEGESVVVDEGSECLKRASKTVDAANAGRNWPAPVLELELEKRPRFDLESHSLFYSIVCWVDPGQKFPHGPILDASIISSGLKSPTHAGRGME